MQQYGPENIRNIVLLSHSGAGKTSAAEAMLFNAGAAGRLGRVDEGTTTSDYDPDEIKRKISINLTLLPLEWKGTKINVLDTPGYFDFVGEVRAGMRVAEGVVILVCATSGIEVGTEQVWQYCEQAALPRLIFINKMDRENADFAKTVGAIQKRFGSRCLPVQVPIGAQSAFKGVVDVLLGKSYTGSTVQEAEVPADLKDEVDGYREKLVEAAAEVDDKLIEKYLGGEELSLDDLRGALRQAVVWGKIVPILVGSALQNSGINLLLDAMPALLPSPKERDVAVVAEGGKEETIKSSADAPLAALVFKTSADPYVGKLTYLRVYSGVMESNSQVWNSARNTAERIGQLFTLRGKNQEPVAQLGVGDIGGVAKLGVTSTNDTLCSKERPIKLAPIKFPEPTLRMAVHPRTKTDVDKLGPALTRLAEEDPTIRVQRDPDTNETLLAGMGDTQLAVAADKMLRKFGVSVELQPPKVPYRETIAVKTRAEYKHKKQTGGHGQYGHVFIEIEPLPRGTGTEFAEHVVGGSVPKNFIPAVEKGVKEAFQEGPLAGYPVADMRATLVDGSFHAVDSSEVSFKIAGAGAVKKGMLQARPILVEPVVDIKVTVPEEYTGDIMSDLNTRRARVQGMTPQDGSSIIEAQVPLAEVLRYAIDLKSITQGRGVFTMQFSHYEEVPQHVAQKIIAERQAEKQAAKA